MKTPNPSNRRIRFAFLTLILEAIGVIVLMSCGQASEELRPEDLRWTSQFGGFGAPARTVAQAADADGSVYVVGGTEGVLPGQGTAGNSDAFVRKYDVSGTEA